MLKTVKTSTPTGTTMQMLCRLWSRLTVRGLVWGLALGLSGGAAVATVNAATASGASPVNSDSGAQVLRQSVVEWVAQTQAVPPDAVELAPLDPRLQIRQCSQPLAMDLPFASVQTVRVRCPQPAWQLYVRVAVAGQTAAPPAPAPLADKAPEPEPALRQVLVAAVPLQRGMRLSAAHVRLAEVDTPGMPVNVLEHLSQVMHAEVVRDVRPGTPLRSQDIRPTVLVKRGQMVLMSVGQSTGFQISARVEAMQDGRYGEQIKLKNRESGRLLSGMVQGPNQVQGL
jgi:flagella basal body P-ring formation protein FlgA